LDNRNDWKTIWVKRYISIYFEREKDFGGPLTSGYIPTIETILRMIPDWEDRFPSEVVKSIKEKMGLIKSKRNNEPRKKCSLQ